MFSVIIPLYNKSRYIEKAILSVLNQTYHEFELIVVDDGSTDHPLPPKGGNMQQRLSFIENISAFTERIKIVEQKNCGVSTARNNGVKLAKYDYIAFLDADDWWAPTYLEEMKELIEQYPQAGIYGSSYFKVKNGQHIPARIGVEPGFHKGLINYFQVYGKTMWMPLWTGATIIKKQVFNSERGFKSALKLGEDFDLWVRIALKYLVALLNKPLAYYNQDVDQISRGVVDEKIYEPSTFVTFNLQFLKEDEEQNQDLKKLLDLLRVYSLMRYRIMGKYKLEVDNVIAEVDFANVERKYYYFYHTPRVFLLIWNRLIKKASGLKKHLCKRKNRIEQ